MFNKNNRNNRNLVLWFVFMVLVIGIANLLKNSEQTDVQDIAFSDFAIKNDISSVVVRGPYIKGFLKNGKQFSTIAPYIDKDLIKGLIDNKVHVEASYSQDSSLITWIGLLLSWIPSLLIVGMMFYSMRKMSGKNGKAGNMFGGTKVRLATKNDKKVTFADVAGAEEAKEELREIVDFLKNKKKFVNLGAKIPRGVLLSGPPGTGKTLLAKSVAGEANVPFFYTSGSDFIEMFAGIGASRVRDMFETGKKNAPCIIFIDEIDAIGANRKGGVGSGCEERDQTLNQLLVEMDGFSHNEGVIILASTNRKEILDPALLRPGRFDRMVTFSLPNLEDRKKILEIYIKKIVSDNSIDICQIARGTYGFSGADLSNLINEAAIHAAVNDKSSVSQDDIEKAKDKVIMGSKKKSITINDEERKLTAYHEAGHALVAIKSKYSDPIHKATIIPRGHALGMVVRLPEKDQVSVTKARLLDDLSVAMGGLAAEKMIFGENYVTTGASSDIKYATNIARNMITKWGMGDAGYVHYSYSDGDYSNSTSESMYQIIDQQVKQITSNAFNNAYQILQSNLGHLHKLANALLEKEELSGKEIESLLTDKAII
ncbi:ATP-dependent zinc metalloprotease FtsH [Candidatus Cytomitobacter indipagum]|uniref:ATP-dependent zinc metalloprotease FtsH n=1 Tax=Candidatus Cytomitobacter indipagum TaxID=2601575 RepID=A0A5C0UDU3_9PROT|nr:ATP-dependent zinc metalloprotease FtsH [Candidatus Cytomitobacter indipagum]QEK38178.1 ATP-dependent zinc metalloprotease FtsH [Candidatus Cytomitobacter indipagum]